MLRVNRKYLCGKVFSRCNDDKKFKYVCCEIRYRFLDLPQHTDLRDSPTSTLCSAFTVCRGPVDKTRTDTGSVRRVLEDILLMFC